MPLPVNVSALRPVANTRETRSAPVVRCTRLGRRRRALFVGAWLSAALGAQMACTPAGDGAVVAAKPPLVEESPAPPLPPSVRESPVMPGPQIVDGVPDAERRSNEPFEESDTPIIRDRAYPASPIHDLEGTVWEAADALVPLRRIHFGANSMTSQFGDGTTLTQWADFSGNHPDCLGYPRCVIEVYGDGNVEPIFLAGGRNDLHAIDCYDWRRVGTGGEMPDSDTMFRGSGMPVLWTSEHVLCLHSGRPLYFRVEPDAPPVFQTLPDPSRPIPPDGERPAP